MLKVFNWILFFLPWVSLFFVPAKNVKRYMPVVVFTTLLMTVFFVTAYARSWWTILEYILPFGHVIDVPFVYGIFPVGTFWIFYLTSHRFWLYAVTNVGINVVFAFGMVPVLEWIGLMRMEKLPPWIGFIISLIFALIIYVYHRWQSEVLIPPVYKKHGDENGGGHQPKRDYSKLRLIRDFMADRGKAR